MKLELNKRKNLGEFTNMWKLSDILPKITNRTKRSYRRDHSFELNKNENIICQNLEHVVKTVHKKMPSLINLHFKIYFYVYCI